jgi:predicted ester cyclase
MDEISGIVRGFIEEVLNRGRIDATGMFFWEDMVEQVPFPGQGPGLEGLKDILRGMRAAFPDMHWRIEQVRGNPLPSGGGRIARTPEASF